LKTSLPFWQLLESLVNTDLNSMGVNQKTLGYEEEEFVFEALLPLLECVLESFYEPLLFPESLVLFRRMVPVIWIFVARVSSIMQSPTYLKICISTMIKFDALLPQNVPPRVFVGLNEALNSVVSGIIQDAGLRRSAWNNTFVSTLYLADTYPNTQSRLS
jgi:hypothetical protein